MTFRCSAPLRFAPAFLLVFSLFAANLDAPPAGLIVHEWGTFTSVAGADGAAADWLPLGGPSDLPCFVDHFANAGFKLGLRGTVRMETPVIYFHTDRERELSAKADFPRGLIRDWYPRSTNLIPQK